MKVRVTLRLSSCIKPLIVNLVLQRMAVVAAGPVVNLVFAVVAYWFMYQSGVSTVVPVIGSVIEGSLAERANLPLNSEILSVDGDETLSWDEVNLKLASRVGESGALALTLRPMDKPDGIAKSYPIDLQKWHIDLENESPLTALGLVPWRPEVPAVIGRLVDEGQAKAAGLQVGDKVLRVNDDDVDGLVWACRLSQDEFWYYAFGADSAR